jgi:bifunctional non-homologous end joining protein LigD
VQERARNRAVDLQSATLDGEAVVCGDDGISDFEKLHSQVYDDHVFLYAFDLLELNGEDCRSQPLETRKAMLETCSRGAQECSYPSTWKVTGDHFRARLQDGT